MPLLDAGLHVLLALLPRASAVDVADGEATRLVEELRQLAAREVWPGVERTYADLRARGVSLPADVHLAAADAARARGALAEEVERLRAALGEGPRRPIAERLAAIEAHCAPVELAGRVGRGVSLVPEALPFDPGQRAAVELAVAEVAATGSFRGWLPRGGYRFGGEAFQVEPGVTVRIDLQRRGKPPAEDRTEPPREPR